VSREEKKESMGWRKKKGTLFLPPGPQSAEDEKEGKKKRGKRVCIHVDKRKEGAGKKGC